MSIYRLPVPTHIVGTDLITVQYDRQMIPYLTGILDYHAAQHQFDPTTGDTIEGRYYLDTLISQLLQEVSMSEDTSYFECSGSDISSHTANVVVWFEETTSPFQEFYFVQQAPTTTGYEIVWERRIASGRYRLYFEYLNLASWAAFGIYVGTNLVISHPQQSGARQNKAVLTGTFQIDIDDFYDVKIVVPNSALTNFGFHRIIVRSRSVTG